MFFFFQDRKKSERERARERERKYGENEKRKRLTDSYTWREKSLGFPTHSFHPLSASFFHLFSSILSQQITAISKIDVKKKKKKNSAFSFFHLLNFPVSILFPCFPAPVRFFFFYSSLFLLFLLPEKDSLRSFVRHFPQRDETGKKNEKKRGRGKVKEREGKKEGEKGKKEARGQSGFLSVEALTV